MRFRLGHAVILPGFDVLFQQVDQHFDHAPHIQVGKVWADGQAEHFFGDSPRDFSSSLITSFSGRRAGSSSER